MENIYQDIATRTNGDIYIGVVGPVRTGKSTFIKKFMEALVIPRMDDAHKKERATDELPQSAGGRTIMTTEPKFIPNEAVGIVLDDHLDVKVRLIDCVGYVIDGAMGYLEDGAERTVQTPWDDRPMLFTRAAEIGTKKVIEEHSTIGLVVTTDGSVTDIPREAYVEAEERVIKELKAINKPFIMLLNSQKPMSPNTQKLKEQLCEKYAVSVVAVNCEELSEADISDILKSVLLEFPVREICIDLPAWVDSLENSHWLNTAILEKLKSAVEYISKVRELGRVKEALSQSEYIDDVAIKNMNLGKGTAYLSAYMPDSLFYKILGETAGMEIDGQNHLISLMKELSTVKREYDKIAGALEEVKQKGYGIVSPSVEELRLEEPEIVRQGGRFGVRLCASAPSIHMICNKPKPLEAA